MKYLKLTIYIPDTKVVNKISKSHVEKQITYMLMTVLSIAQDSIKISWGKE